MARREPDHRAILALDLEIASSASHHTPGTCKCHKLLMPIELPVRMARAAARLRARPFAKQGANRTEGEVLDATTNSYAGRVRLLSV